MVFFFVTVNCAKNFGVSVITPIFSVFTCKQNSQNYSVMQSWFFTMVTILQKSF